MAMPGRAMMTFEPNWATSSPSTSTTRSSVSGHWWPIAKMGAADEDAIDLCDVLSSFSSQAKPTREFPRLCRGGSKSLTYREVGSLGPWTGLQTVSHQAHERSPANGVATRSKATRLQMDGLPESEVRMSEKHTRFLGRHCAMRVGMRIDAARTSRFERLPS